MSKANIKWDVDVESGALLGIYKGKELRMTHDPKRNQFVVNHITSLGNKLVGTAKSKGKLYELIYQIFN
jgi:hypothetical protein